MPSQLMMAALLHWVFVVAICGLAVVTFVGYSMRDIMFWSIWAGLGVVCLGLLNVPAALALHHPHFPQAISSRIATVITLVTFAGALFRSVGNGDHKIVPMLGVAAILVLCTVNLFLTTRPQVKQWIAARRQLSLSQGHGPRR
ncbi:hypothetical protein SK803_27330 [Lentzea sp. BCCO 10_0856]|uniref:Uncharacterized protein n=1 Tax=Lentzea miocenica TaxID=3095431 RepID=A0ABU4T713_9PSEU|nr:hypothetical protein [Lentzea sp. BCCO 10_0856]MDX8033951.1 hypothetical protein [Lentzea sp. BCCO 10_0856]